MRSSDVYCWSLVAARSRHNCPHLSDRGFWTPDSYTIEGKFSASWYRAANRCAGWNISRVGGVSGEFKWDIFGLYRTCVLTKTWKMKLPFQLSVCGQGLLYTAHTRSDWFSCTIRHERRLVVATKCTSHCSQLFALNKIKKNEKPNFRLL
jgi:hypothetical protein